MNSGIEPRPYNAEFRASWDDLVGASSTGTILHTRNFLEYHGNRFEDCSLVFLDPESHALVGVWPMARAHNDPQLAISHAGSTFGGVVLRRPHPVLMADCIAAGARCLSDAGFRKIRNKMVPALFSHQVDETELSIFSRAGRLVRADLWNLVRLDRPFETGPSRRAAVRAATRRGVSVRSAITEQDWISFHQMLRSNLSERHQAEPTHSLEELLDLRQRLGSASNLLLAHSINNELVAGTWLLDYGLGTRHTQYIASTELGRSLAAVDLLLDHAIKLALGDGCTQFSFGSNILRDGFTTNAGLMTYKLRFGGGVCVHFQAESDLGALADTAARIMG